MYICNGAVMVIIKHYILTYQLNVWQYLFVQEPAYNDLYRIKHSSSQHKMDEHRPV